MIRIKVIVEMAILERIEEVAIEAQHFEEQ